LDDHERNSAATIITDFTDGVVGQTSTIVFGDANTSVTDGGNLHLAGGFTSTADDTLTLVTTDGTNWYEVSRSVN
jgi:hypothetical protein